MKPLIVGLLGLALTTLSAGQGSSAGQGRQTFVGTMTDEMCAEGNHTRMRMGPTDAECTVACVLAHGSRYVLYDGKTDYILSDQKTPEQFAGQKVRVVGTLDAKTKTIRVESIAAAD